MAWGKSEDEKAAAAQAKKAKREAKQAELQERMETLKAKAPASTGLGVGAGSMIDNRDGTISYRATGNLTQAFRVNIADVTGFAVRKGNKMLERTFVVLGHGTELAEVSVAHGVSEKIEQWIREHPDFRGNVPQASTTAESAAAPRSALSVADELAKLAELRNAGVLTDDEFAAQKAKLLG